MVINYSIYIHKIISVIAVYFRLSLLLMQNILKNIFEILENLVENSDKIQTVAISGKNEKVYNKFIEIAKDKENVKILEYSNKLPELESVTDLVITKPRWSNSLRVYCNFNTDAYY